MAWGTLSKRTQHIIARCGARAHLPLLHTQPAQCTICALRPPAYLPLLRGVQGAPEAHAAALHV